MKPNKLPPEIMKHLPPPAILDCLSLVPREKPEAMIEIVAGWVDKVADLMTTEAWQGRLRSSIRAAVQGGKLAAMQVVGAAERSRVVDIALREILGRPSGHAPGRISLPAILCRPAALVAD